MERRSAPPALCAAWETLIPQWSPIFIGHYPIGLTLGVVLAFGLKLGVIGMWWGLAAGLISVATLVLWRWRHLTRDLSRLKRLQGE